MNGHDKYPDLYDLYAAYKVGFEKSPLNFEAARARKCFNSYIQDEVYRLATYIKQFGRKLFQSNLFVCATR